MTNTVARKSERTPPSEQVSLKTWIGVGTILGAFMAVLDIQITNAYSIAVRKNQTA